MHCQLRSADRMLFDGDAVMVVAKSALGEFAVMERHAPLLAVLETGAVRVKTGDGEEAFAVGGGLLRVQENRVTVLADEAVSAREVDLACVASRLDELEQELARSRDKEPLLREQAYLRAQKRAKEHHA